MKKPHRDILIMTGVTVVFVAICIIAIFGLPFGNGKGGRLNIDGVAVDTIMEGDIPILDNDIVIPLTPADTTDVDPDGTSIIADGTLHTNDSIKQNEQHE